VVTCVFAHRAVHEERMSPGTAGKGGHGVMSDFGPGGSLACVVKGHACMHAWSGWRLTTRRLIGVAGVRGLSMGALVLLI
jgi:hypothetical protein